jgi:rRNA biogenesis protein RRP5
MASIKRKGSPTEEKKSSKTPHVDHRSPKRRRKSELESTKENSKKTLVSTVRPTKLSSLREEEPAFLRGGASILTPLEQKQIQIDATRDVLFEQNAPRNPSGTLDGDGEGVDGAAQAPKQKNSRVKKNRKVNAKAEREDGVKIESLSFKVCGSLVGCVNMY